MKRRIACWAIVGLVVAIGWGFVATTSRPASSSLVWTLIDITCPIAMLRAHPLSVYVALLANTATYALVGLGVESVRMARAHG